MKHFWTYAGESGTTLTHFSVGYLQTVQLRVMAIKQSTTIWNVNKFYFVTDVPRPLSNDIFVPFQSGAECLTWASQALGPNKHGLVTYIQVNVYTRGVQYVMKTAQ